MIKRNAPLDRFLFQLKSSQAWKGKRRFAVTVKVSRLVIPYHTCLGQVLTLFGTAAIKNSTPCLGQQGRKTIPFPSARPRIAQIRE